MRAIHLLAGISACVIALQAPGADATPATSDPQPLQLAVDLTDGSRIIGIPAVDKLQIKTAYAALDVKLSVMRAIEFKGGSHEVQVSLQNGDTVSGQFAATEIVMKTSFGGLTVPMDKVTRIRVRSGDSKSLLPEGCVLDYTFDVDEGGRITDASGTGNDGTVVGATHVEEDNKGAMKFTGGDQQIAVKTNRSLELQDFTLSLWVKRSDPNQVSAGGSGTALIGYGRNGYCFGMMPNGELYLCKLQSGAVTATSRVPDMNFHQVAVTKAAGKVVFYVDGVPTQGQDFGEQFEFGTDFGVGSVQDPGHYCFMGLIREAAVFNRALSAEEMKSVYDSQK